MLSQADTAGVHTILQLNNEGALLAISYRNPDARSPRPSPVTSGCVMKTISNASSCTAWKAMQPSPKWPTLQGYMGFGMLRAKAQPWGGTWRSPSPKEQHCNGRWWKLRSEEMTKYSIIYIM